MNKTKNFLKNSANKVRMFCMDVSNMRAAQVVLTTSMVVGTQMAHANGGLSTFFTNANSVGQMVIKFMILVGVVVGLGMILKGLLDAMKIGKAGHDDITWGSVLTKLVVGSAAMALAFIGTMLVTTFGGSESDIGKGLNVGS